MSKRGPFFIIFYLEQIKLVGPALSSRPPGVLETDANFYGAQTQNYDLERLVDGSAWRIPHDPYHKLAFLGAMYHVVTLAKLIGALPQEAFFPGEEFCPTTKLPLAATLFFFFFFFVNAKSIDDHWKLYLGRWEVVEFGSAVGVR